MFTDDSNFGSDATQKMIKYIWGYLFNESDYPIAYNKFSSAINKEVCKSNTVFIKYNRFCRHGIHITEIDGKIKVKSPMVGIVVYNKNKRNVTYLDICHTIYKKHNSLNFLHCCYQTIKAIHSCGNNIFTVDFNEDDEYDIYKDRYNNMMGKIMRDINPFIENDDDIEQGLGDIEQGFRDIDIAKEQFKYNKSAIYNFL